MKLPFITIILIALGILSCKNETATASQNTSNKDTTTSSTTTELVAVAPDTGMLPLLPFDTAKAVIEKCDYIDLIFYNYGISINISEPNNAKGVASSLMSTQLPPNMNCRQGFGFVSFQGNGETLAEAQIYFQQGCTYLVFRKGDSNLYVCAISNKGIQFLNNIIQRQQRK